MRSNKKQFFRTSFTFIVFVSFTIQTSFAQKKIAKLDSDLKETSGLQLLPSENLASINDSGNRAEVFIINTKGETLKKIIVHNFKNNDWEAITIDNKNNLYIGDFGNNANKRKNLFIGVFESNYETSDSISPKYTIQFNYEDQISFPPQENNLRFDCEAFIVVDSIIYLFSKSRVKPFDGKVYVYQLINKPGQQTAKITDTLQLCDNGMIRCWVTDADYNFTHQQVVILTTKKVYLFKLDTSFKLITSQKIKGLKQREGISFSNNKNQFFMTDEKHFILGGGNLYKFKIK